MSTEEIIKAWKNDEEPEKKDGQAPASPAGDQEVSDEELEKVDGGMIPSKTYGICTISCI